MTDTQILHIGMTNSFNLITGRNKLNEIIKSDLNFLIHNPEKKVSIQVIDSMIEYFQSIDMIDNCLELMEYIALNFKGEPCLCEYPVITEYGRKMFCGNCQCRIRK